MSLRNRIVVVFVLLVFVVPVSGWAASAQLNPDGLQLSAFGDEAPVSAPDSAPPVGSSWEAVVPSVERTSTAGFFDRFLVWFQAMVQPL